MTAPPPRPTDLEILRTQLDEVTRFATAQAIKVQEQSNKIASLETQVVHLLALHMHTGMQLDALQILFMPPALPNAAQPSAPPPAHPSSPWYAFELYPQLQQTAETPTQPPHPASPIEDLLEDLA